MEQTFNAILIHPNDNVATVTTKLHDSDLVCCRKDGESYMFTTSGVPIYHKVAVTDIPAGQPVRKYGEVMAVATRDIVKGEHVHTHNVTSAVQ